MPRLLVVLDASAEAAEALERALDVAGAVDGSELILLGIAPSPPVWDHGGDGRTNEVVQEILARAVSAAERRGIRADTRIETGEKADVVTRVAGRENCDQIFVAEAPATFASRALMALSAACTGRVSSQIIRCAGIPVTVIAPREPR